MPGDPDAVRLVLFLTDGYVGGEDRMVGLVAEHRNRDLEWYPLVFSPT